MQKHNAQKHVNKNKFCYISELYSLATATQTNV